MRPLAFLLGACLLGATAAGCSVEFMAQGESAAVTRNQCIEDSDCGAGACQAGACVAREGVLDTVLLEVTPPASAERIGGARFLQIARGFSRSRTGYELAVHRLATVRGFVRPYESLAKDCPGIGETVPAKISLTPTKRVLGLPTARQVAKSALRVLSEEARRDHSCADQLPPGGELHEFVLRVPEGSYDIYVEPMLEDGAAVESGRCEMVPRLLRARNLEAGEVCLPLRPPEPRVLEVLVHWPFGAGRPLQGWTADIIHPVTGKRLSSRQVIGDAVVETESALAYQLHVAYSEVSGEDSVGPGQELVRLRPPADEPGPVIQLERSALEAFAAGQAVIGNLEPFPPPRELDWWVWREDEETPVAATVTLTSIRVQGVNPGIFASFRKSVEVGEDGRLRALVLPGEYRVRTVPQAGSGLAATEATVSVPCLKDAVDPTRCRRGDPDAEPEPFAGNVLWVPPAAELRGMVRSPMGGLLEGATVHAVPPLRQRRACPPEDPGCPDVPLRILDSALGEDPFVPRGTSGIVAGGAFVIEEMDCGECEPGKGAYFDVSVRPAEGSRLAWLVRPDVLVDTAQSLGELELPMPVIHRGVVQVPSASGGAAAIVPGALVRAYIFRDERGRYVDDPDSLTSCAAQGSRSVGEQCLSSLLQIGEARAREDGTFELVLPAELR